MNTTRTTLIFFCVGLLVVALSLGTYSRGQSDNPETSLQHVIAARLVNVRMGEFPALFVRFGDAGYFYRNLTAHMNQNPSIGMPR